MSFVAIRRVASVAAKQAPFRSLSGGPEIPTEAALSYCAKDAVAKSCFLNIDFKIAEDVPVYEAIKRMAANRIGALAVVSASDHTKIIGVVSERDYLTKVALLGKASKTTPVIQICTHGDANLVTVSEDETVDECMRKVLSRDIRHLLVRDKSGKIVSMFSVKDLCKCVVARHSQVVERLTNFGVGKGAFFGSE